MKKLIFIPLVLFVIVGFFVLKDSGSDAVVLNNPPAQEAFENNAKETLKITSTPTLEISKPTILKIPSLNVSANVEYVGMDETGRMGVPKNDDNVAWWMLGVVPGKAGNAVMAGHYDRKTGGPAVFYELNKLEIGDEIVVVDEKGSELVFEVYKKEIYKDSAFPIETVFGSSEVVGLNLITCDGIFDQTNKNYSDRLVVFSKSKKVI